MINAEQCQSSSPKLPESRHEGQEITPMIRQDKRPLDLKVAVLVAVYAGLAVFSFVWYDTLVRHYCDGPSVLEKHSASLPSDGSVQSCIEQLHLHWIKFYGINVAIYGTGAYLIASSWKIKKTGRQYD